MSLDPKMSGLMRDVDVARERVAHQLATDPDHEVALQMFLADVRRAEFLLMEYTSARPHARPVGRWEGNRWQGSAAA